MSNFFDRISPLLQRNLPLRGDTGHGHGADHHANGASHRGPFEIHPQKFGEVRTN